ncbi:MAG: GNAT family N-acetyltransferase [Methylovirgula sp.]
MRPTQPGASAETARLRTTLAKVEVHLDPAPILHDWAELEAAAPASVYQTRAFVIAWLETIGVAREIQPFFVLARDRQDRAAALLCLGIERHGPFRVASFLGGRESNFNLGLFRPDLSVTRADLESLLRTASKALGRSAPHVFLLKNQPYAWEDIANPLALLPHQPSPSFAYATELSSPSEKFLAGKLSKDTRKKLRKKEARLGDVGPVSAISNDTPATARAILETFLAEKIARCEARSLNVDFTDPAVQAFLERLSYPTDSGAPWLEFHALKAGERIVATYAGAAHRKHFSCMVNSFDADPEIAKSSPGDLLLMRLVASRCDKGLKSFDLGIGEARYKETYCDVTIALFDAILPISSMGRLAAGLAGLRLRAKRMIKQNPKLLAQIGRLRRILPGL